MASAKAEPWTFASWVRMRMASRHEADTTKARGAMPKDQAKPMPATMRPPAAGPMSPWVSCPLIWLSALPWTSRCSSSNSGMMAMEAGPKKASAVPKMADLTMSCHRRNSWWARRRATTPTATPHTASDVSMASRFGTRSTTTPPNRAKHTEGTARAASTYARSMGLWPILRAVRANAIVKTPSPREETVWPDHNNAKSRTLRASKVPVDFVDADIAINTFISRRGDWTRFTYHDVSGRGAAPVGLGPRDRWRFGAT